MFKTGSLSVLGGDWLNTVSFATKQRVSGNSHLAFAVRGWGNNSEFAVGKALKPASPGCEGVLSSFISSSVIAASGVHSVPYFSERNGSEQRSESSKTLGISILARLRFRNSDFRFSFSTFPSNLFINDEVHRN